MQFINGETGLRYENRQRCVVMCDGFDWKSVATNREKEFLVEYVSDRIDLRRNSRA